MNNFGEKVSFIWSVADLIRGPYQPNQYEEFNQFAGELDNANQVFRRPSR